MAEKIEALRRDGQGIGVGCGCAGYVANYWGVAFVSGAASKGDSRMDHVSTAVARQAGSASGGSPASATVPASCPDPRQLALGIVPEQPLSARHRALVEAHKPKIAQALRQLERGLSELSDALAEVPFAVVFEPLRAPDGQVLDYRRLEHAASRDAVRDAYTTIELLPAAAANEPLRCTGAVGVETCHPLRIAEEVNRRKGVLKAAFAPIGELRFLATVRVNGQQFNRQMPLARYILRQLEAASLNRLGAYRQIPIVAAQATESAPPTPDEIRWSEQWTRSQPRKTLRELIDQALEAGRIEEVEAMRASGIPAREYLYRPKAPQLRMRAAVIVPQAAAAAGRPGRKAPYRWMTAELPLLFLRDRKRPWPQLKPPRPRGEMQASSRPKALLEESAVFGTQGHFRRAVAAERELAPE